MKRIATFLPVVLFVGIAVALGLSVGKGKARKVPEALIDRAAPTFNLPPLLVDGKGVSNADFGGKIVLLNVFASWCPVCKQEHPQLMRLAATSGIPFYGINWKDEPGKGAQFLRVNKSPYVRVAEDANGAVGSQLGVTGVPETFVIDASGRIRYRHAGPLTPEVWREVFEPLLAHIKTERGG